MILEIIWLIDKGQEIEGKEESLVSNLCLLWIYENRILISLYLRHIHLFVSTEFNLNVKCQPLQKDPIVENCILLEMLNASNFGSWFSSFIIFSVAVITYGK